MHSPQTWGGSPATRHRVLARTGRAVRRIESPGAAPRSDAQRAVTPSLRESSGTGRQGPQGNGHDARSFSSGQMSCRKARPSPRARSAAGAEGRRTQGALLFTPGILPSALRAGFAVRAAPAAQWLLSLTPGMLPSALRASCAVRPRSRRGRGQARESDSASARTSKALTATTSGEARDSSLRRDAGERARLRASSTRKKRSATRTGYHIRSSGTPSSPTPPSLPGSTSKATGWGSMARTCSASSRPTSR